VLYAPCPPPLVARPPGRSRITVASYGFDPSLCGIGAGVSGALFNAGLRVPTLATDVTADRYLFQLATVPVAYKQKVWVVGLGQGLELGFDSNAQVAPVYPVTKQVGRASGDPFWSFPDGNVSWGLRFVRDPPLIPWANQNVLSTDSFSWRWCPSPALVFETATFNPANLDANGHPDNYTTLTSYTAPAISSEPLGGGLGYFTELRFPIDDPSKEAIEPIEVEGPGAIVFYASLWQTNPETRAKLTLPPGFPMDPEMPEEAFVTDFTNLQPSQINSPIYWRIYGQITVER
jgi:hypothetical protein